MRYKELALILLVAGVAGCASGGARTLGGDKVVDVLTTFQNGELRLVCETSCSGAWGGVRRNAKSLYNNKLWSDLVVEVANIGFKSDLTYFYLGRSAEELNHKNAARTYFNLSLANRYKCAGLINNCDGFDVPAESRDALARLDSITLPAQSKTEALITEVPKVELPKDDTTQSKNSATANATPKTDYKKSISRDVGRSDSAPLKPNFIYTVKVEFDEFQKITTFTGSNTAPDGDYLILRGFKEKSGIGYMQIYLADYYYGEWRFYRSAYDSDGNRLDLNSISRDVVNCNSYQYCNLVEHIGITVSKSYLESKRRSGIRFKVSGKAGEEIFFFPPEHISAFLDAFNRN